MKVLINGEEIETDRVDIIYKEEISEDVYGEVQLKCSTEGLIIDVVKDGEDDVARSCYYFVDDLNDLAH
jgi:hypothetical protein